MVLRLVEFFAVEPQTAYPLKRTSLENRMNVDKATGQTETENREVRDKDKSTDGGASGVLTFGVTFIMFFVLAALVLTAYLIWGRPHGA